MSSLPNPYVFDDAELARRRSASRRMAWAIGLAAALIYIGGFFLQR
jgi:hypothetical protein